MSVAGFDETGDAAVDVERWVRLAEAVLVAEGVDPAGELTLVFVDESPMGDLNIEHMGHEGPTDVLAFPLDGVGSDVAGPVLLGDVVVCPAVAAVNARDAGHDLDAELALLVVHGILHVLGMDHAEPSEAAAMQARERELLASCAQVGST